MEKAKQAWNQLLVAMIKKIITFSFLIVIIPLLTTELLFRIFFPQISSDSYYYNEMFESLSSYQVIIKNTNNNKYEKKFGFIYSPNTEIDVSKEEFQYKVKTNSLGFRTREVSPKDKNEYRVLLLGDSMFFGVGVNNQDTIASQLETFHNRLKKNNNLKVYNFSVEGYNNVQEYIVAKTFIPQLNVDHIVLGLYIANDIVPNAVSFIDNHGDFAISNEQVVRIKKELAKRSSIPERSTIYRLLSVKYIASRIRYQMTKIPWIIKPTYDCLLSFKELCKSNNIKFSVILIYPDYGINGNFVEKWRGSRGLGNTLNRFCKQNSIEVLDTLQFMSGEEAEKMYYWKTDHHLNNAGNKLLAEVIYNKLIAPQLRQKEIN
jgi:hypothetical protein